jgi:hypothetical protein
VSFSDAEMMKMAMPTLQPVTEEKKQVSSSDYAQFFKKKVKVNAVEKHVREYQLNQQEIDFKKRKNKK